MKGTQISNIRRHRKHSGLSINRTWQRWVAVEMAEMAPCTVQLNSFAWNKKLAKYAKDGQPEKAMQLFQQMQQNHPQMIEICAELK
jgi:pentatricopeptide repeat protein